MATKSTWPARGGADGGRGDEGAAVRLDVGSIAVVGGGVAAISAARQLWELGYSGRIRVFSAEETIPYERPTLSKDFLVGSIEAPPPVFNEEELLAAGVELELGTRVLAIDPARATVTTAREEIRYDKLLLAPGAEARRLTLPGSDLGGLFYLRELPSACRLREALQPGARLVLIGAGMIGLEVAAAAVRLDCIVTVIEISQQVMGRVLPAGLAGTIARLHRNHGVELRTGVRPVRYAGNGRHVRTVVLENHDAVEVDVVLVGIGVTPRTELAERAGLAVQDGIAVDELFRTSAENVFAAGDAAQVFHRGQGRMLRTESWRPAEEQGRLAAASMLGMGKPYDAIPWMWSDQYDALVQVAGFGFEHTEIIECGSLEEPSGLVYLGVRNGALVVAGGVCFGTGVARTIRAAQELIARRVSLDVHQLRDWSVEVTTLTKGLLALARA